MKKHEEAVTQAQIDEFWAAMERVAEEGRKMPDWMKGGVDVNPEYFETTRPLRSAQPAARKQRVR